MRSVRSDLADLPTSFADDPQPHLLSLCGSFVQEITKYTNGQPAHPPNQPTFLREALRHYRALEKEIKRTRPQFEVTQATNGVDVEDGFLDITALKVVITLKDIINVIDEMSIRE